MLQSAELLLLLLVLKLRRERLSHRASSNSACIGCLHLLNAGWEILCASVCQADPLAKIREILLLISASLSVVE